MSPCCVCASALTNRSAAVQAKAIQDYLPSFEEKATTVEQYMQAHPTKWLSGDSVSQPLAFMTATISRNVFSIQLSYVDFIFCKLAPCYTSR